MLVLKLPLALMLTFMQWKLKKVLGDFFWEIKPHLGGLDLGIPALLATLYWEV